VPEIPPEAQNAVTQATALIWKIATDHQTEAINAVRQECNRIEQEALAERDEALKEIQFLENQLQNLKTNLETVEKQNRTITTEKASLELQIQKQQLIIDSTTIANEELKNEVKELRRITSTAQSEASKLEGMLEVYKSQSRTQNEPEPKTQPTAKSTTARKTVPKAST
jgi:chromosome segregation ATPase